MPDQELDRIEEIGREIERLHKQLDWNPNEMGALFDELKKLHAIEPVAVERVRSTVTQGWIWAFNEKLKRDKVRQIRY